MPINRFARRTVALTAGPLALDRTRRLVVFTVPGVLAAAALLLEGQRQVLPGQMAGAAAAKTVHDGAQLGTPRTARQADSSRGTLIATAAMSLPRMAHTATTLSDGRVLVAGGFTSREKAAYGAEVYDPSTGRFAPLPPMVTLRHSHTATLLPSGKVLIAGGYAEGKLQVTSAELFDPATNSFTPTGALLSARSDHVAVLLTDGRVLIAGGVGPGWTFLSSAEIYDPTTGRFSATGDMTVARESHIAVRLLNGEVLIVGGHRGRHASLTVYSSAEVYDPASGTFRHQGDMRVPRHKHDAVLLRDGRVLVTGGSDALDNERLYNSTELFAPASGSFTMGPAMKLPRYKHQGSSVLLPNGMVLIAGGAPQAEMYDPISRTFEIVSGDVRVAGLFSAVAPLARGGALITGGYGNVSGPRAEAWLYRP